MRSPRICRLALLGSALAFAVLPARLGACKILLPRIEPTLVAEYEKAHLVLLGTFTEPRPAPGGEGSATADFLIERSFKEHPILAGKNAVTLPRYASARSKFLIFCTISKDAIDPYRAIEVRPGSELVKYLQGALALKGRPRTEQLRHAFDNLGSRDAEVGQDAYREFATTDYREYRDLAKNLPAEKVAQWLQDPKAPAERFGLYASLLGHCGDPAKHGKLLRSLIDDRQKRGNSGLDGALAAYVLLQPEQGWDYVRRLLSNGNEDFLVRYAALRAVRFFWSERTDVLPKADLVAGVAPLLAHPDMADFAVEDLRKWQRWELADRVLALFNRESHKVPIIRRSILRFALQCPGPRAALFVREQRQRDAEWVRETEELLRLEAEAPQGRARRKAEPVSP